MNQSGLTNYIHAQHSGITFPCPARFQQPFCSSNALRQATPSATSDPGQDNHNAPTGGMMDNAEDNWDGLENPLPSCSEEDGVQERHPYINGMCLQLPSTFSNQLLGCLCTKEGEFLPCDAPPPPPDPTQHQCSSSDFFPFQNSQLFKLGELLFVCDQMPATNINELFSVLQDMYNEVPFKDAKDLHGTIDNSNQTH